MVPQAVEVKQLIGLLKCVDLLLAGFNLALAQNEPHVRRTRRGRSEGEAATMARPDDALRVTASGQPRPRDPWRARDRSPLRTVVRGRHGQRTVRRDIQIAGRPNLCWPDAASGLAPSNQLSIGTSVTGRSGRLGLGSYAKSRSSLISQASTETRVPGVSPAPMAFKAAAPAAMSSAVA